jgi:biopolymer transport protein ExbB
MKLFFLNLVLLLGVSSSVFAGPPKNLDELLDQVKRERILEQQQNKLREAEFVTQRDQQLALLNQAKAQLAFEEKRGEQLNQTFQDQEKQIAEQEALLREQSGSLGELFGTVRQIANDTRGIMNSSLTSVLLPERTPFLEQLSERKQQPTIDELRNLWLVLQQEMTESSKVIKQPLPVIVASGEVEQRDVTRVGVFTAFSDGQFLRYVPETNSLVELGRQPVERLQKTAFEFESAEQGSVEQAVVDPTRGAIMALLVQAPSYQERIQQGGWIAYLILLLGAVGLLIALYRFIVLTLIGQGVAKQQKQAEPLQTNPLGRILSVYNDKLAQDVETLALKLDEAILREIPKIERGLITLAVLAAIAPMLGLLGTVSGMIETFQSITLFGTGDPKLMSGGISQALVTTELGLAVAIPILLIHSALSGKSNRLVQILDEESAAIVARNAESQPGTTDK